MTAFDSDNILARLMELHRKKIDLSLDRLNQLLVALDHPELHLPPVVHIAGTNGKGSTLAMLDAMLSASGKKVHRYISPHLVRFNERILIHGQPIAENDLAACLEQCERANTGAPITFFEITTAAALLAFNSVPADYVLLETGLGGRLDATNVCPKPELTLITPISMDHEAFLGDTLTKIAAEKAGIIKANVPLLCGNQEAEAMAVLQDRAAALNAPVRAANMDWRVVPRESGFDLLADGKVAHFSEPALAGTYQFDNAGLAVMAARHLGVPEDAIRQGLQTVEWPARLQPITSGPLVASLARGQEIWLDGGHNPAAGQAMADSIGRISGGRPVDVVLGMLNTKDVGAYLAPLAPHIDRLLAVEVPEEDASRDPDETASLAREMGYNASSSPSVEEAVAMLSASRSGPGLILICGSLYLAGHVLRTIEGASPDGFNIKG